MRLVLTLLLCVPTLAFAASGNDWNPPKPTETTKVCKGKRVWDETKKRCVRPKQSSLNQEQLLGAARELAYADRPQDAQAILAAMKDQTDPMVLTYWGFTHRKLGNQRLAETYYQQALEKNPKHHLARSYLGQGYLEQGRFGLALAQLKIIKDTGGAGTWAEASLRKALETGVSSNY